MRRTYITTMVELRRYFWILLLATVIACNLLYITSKYFQTASSPVNIPNFDETNFIVSSVTSKSQLKKVLIVSFFRSGSSWFGELLSKAPKSFYVYEPLHLTTEPITEGEDELYNNYKLPRLEELFQCGISPRFMWHLMKYGTLYRTPQCPRKNCTARDITKFCESSDFITIKTVRLLLSEAENLLIKPSLFDLKILLLIRDPRGVLNSLSNMNIKMKKRIPLLCSIIRQNIQSYQILKPIYPGNIFFVRYEDLARFPFDTALKVWKFIMGDEVTKIPNEFKQYLEASIEKKGSNKIGSYKVNEKSTQDWQDWRTSIPEELLKFAQEDCDDVIKILGYKNLGDIEKARDLNYSVLEKKYCTDIPCK